MPPRDAVCGGGADRSQVGSLPRPSSTLPPTLPIMSMSLTMIAGDCMLRSPFRARAIALAGVTAAAAASVALWHTELLVARGFGKALEGARPGLSFQPGNGGGRTPTIAGDEGYWLTRAEVESPTPFAKPLALGDRITISGRDGRSHQLEIVALKAIGTSLPAATH